MTRIQIVAAKPNPTGRDKAGSFPLTRQLQGEWVDIQNTSSSRTSLSGVSFAHLAFGPVCSNPQTSTAWRDIENLVLEPNEVLRIHSGKSGDHWHMATEDRIGADKHRWTERNSFILNNGACGDALSLWYYDSQWHKLDEASYSPFPPEGAVLRRLGCALQVTALSGFSIGHR